MNLKVNQQDQEFKKIPESIFLEKIKTSKLCFGLRESLKLKKGIICVFDKYIETCGLKEMKEEEIERIRTFNGATLKKLTSLLNRPHKINVIGF